MFIVKTRTDATHPTYEVFSEDYPNPVAWSLRKEVAEAIANFLNALPSHITWPEISSSFHGLN